MRTEAVDLVYVIFALILTGGLGAFIGGLKGFSLGVRVGAFGAKSAGAPKDLMGLIGTIVQQPGVGEAIGGLAKRALGGLFGGKKGA